MAQEVLGDLGGSRRGHVLLAFPVEMRYLTPSIPPFLFSSARLLLSIGLHTSLQQGGRHVPWMPQQSPSSPTCSLHHITAFAFPP